MARISIRFFNDREVRTVWDDATNGWFFSVLDVVGVLNAQDDYTKNRNYLKWLKAKLKREHLQVAFGCTGGQHRSVYFAERMAERLSGIDGVEVEIKHTAQAYWRTR